MDNSKLYEHYEALPMNWNFLLRATTRWRKSRRSRWLMLLASSVCFGATYFGLSVTIVFLGVLFASLSLYDHLSVNRWKEDVELGKAYILKDIRALSGAVEHQKLSDELKQAFIARLGEYERLYLKLGIDKI